MRDISLHLLDIIQNSLAAKADKIEITISAKSGEDRLELIVDDNGCGMDSETVKKVIDPFYTTRTTRKIGLGIPLFKASCENADGDLTITSECLKGTKLIANFQLSHIDRLPLGNISETVTSVIMSYPAIQIILNLYSEKNSFTFDSNMIKTQLGDVPINHYDVITWISEYIEDSVKITFGGVLHEINC